MSEACAHDPRDIPGKLTYRRRRIYRKHLCRACGRVREYSMPVDTHGIWNFGPWMPPS